MWLKRPWAYIFLAEQALVLASHMAPALWQSALVFAVVTSPLSGELRLIVVAVAKRASKVPSFLE